MISIYQTSNLRLLDRIVHKSKADAIRGKIMDDMEYEDRAQALARIQAVGAAKPGSEPPVPLLCSTVLHNSPHLICVGGADCSLAIYDITNQASRKRGPLGRISGSFLLSAPTACLSVTEKKHAFGAHDLAAEDVRRRTNTGPGGQGQPPSSPPRLGATHSNSSSPGNSPAKNKSPGKSQSPTKDGQGGDKNKNKYSSSLDDADAHYHSRPIQTIYWGTAVGSLMWLSLHQDLGFKVKVAENVALFEQSLQEGYAEGARRDKSDKIKAQGSQGGRSLFGNRSTNSTSKQGYDAARRKLPSEQVHSDEITKAIFLQDLQCVLTASKDGTVGFFNHRTKSQIRTFKGMLPESAKNGITSLAYSMKTKSAVCACDRSLAFWEIHTEEITNKLTGLPAVVTCVEVEDRHDIVVALLANCTAMLWGSLNFELRQVIDVRGGAQGSLSKSDDLAVAMLLFENENLTALRRGGDNDNDNDNGNAGPGGGRTITITVTAILRHCV